MIIRGSERLFTVTVVIKGSNRLPDGKRQNTMRSFTCLDTTVDEVTKVIQKALEQVQGPTAAKFKLGQTVATPAALKVLAEAEQSELGFLLKHEAGDWGELCQEDCEQQDRSLLPGAEPERLMSVWHTKLGRKFWIMTEWDRSVTTVLLPEDY